MIRFLPTVRLVELPDELCRVLQLAALWSLRAGVDVDVNSVDDGRHGASTLHGASLAVDLDPATDTAEHTRGLAVFLARRLPPGFDVVFEADHVHVEYDSGRRVPPAPRSGLPAG